MGASGNISIINLKEFSFDDIKNIMLDKLLDSCPIYSDPNNEIEKLYFEVDKLKNFNDFAILFSTKIVDYCPFENGIFINNKFYNGWGGQEMPQIIDNHLVIYDTDQQMNHQNIPCTALKKLITNTVEIWS